MTITKTVEIPDNHRLVIDVPRDVPRDVPSGPVILTFTPAYTNSVKTSVQGNTKKKLFSLAVDMSDFTFNRNEINER